MTEKNVIEIDNEKEDLIGAGFKKLDSKYLDRRAPTINWGIIYKNKSDTNKIIYLEKLASAMNHAASLVQEERNALGKLCAIKEEQIQQLTKAMHANSNMLQSEVTKMNAMKQDFNKEFARLNKIVKELKEK